MTVADAKDFIAHHGEQGMQSDPLDDVLEHFGIRGMKWGVIRDPSGSHGGAKGTDNPLKGVTDEDLRKMVNRLQMEQQFRSLSEKTSNKTAVDHGATFMKSVVLPAVKVAIAGAITAQVASVLKPSSGGKAAKGVTRATLDATRSQSKAARRLLELSK